MNNVTAVGIDLSNEVMHFFGVNHRNTEVFRKEVPRGRVLETI